MSDTNLLAFGCGVAFIALAGAYIHLRESFLRGTSAWEERPHEPEVHRAEAEQHQRKVG
jgi:hypothetical protein